MPNYQKIGWIDDPAGTNPNAPDMDAGNFNHMDQGIADAQAGLDGKVTNAGRVPSLQQVDNGGLPAAGIADRLYVVVGRGVYRDNGAGMERVAVLNFQDLANLPNSFPPSAHKASHATGGSDVLLPSDIGAVPASDKGAAGGVATLRSDTAKIPLSQIDDSLIGGVNYRGTWDASANAPVLASGAGTKGNYYRVNVAGITNLDGTTDWKVGDWAIYDGAAWQKVDNTDQVTSVAGKQGVVLLTPADVGAPPTARQVATQAPLTGGGDLSADRTIGLADVANLTPGQYQLATVTVDQKGRVTAIAAGAAGGVADASATQKGASRLTANPVTATDPVAMGANDPAFADYISGLQPIWNSASSVSVRPGAAWIPGANRIVNVPATLTQSNLSLTPSAHHYLYLYLDASGNPALELSTVAPVVYKGTARVKGPSATPDNTRRFLAPFLADATAAPGALRQVQMSVYGEVLEVAYVAGTGSAPYRVLNNGAIAANPASLDLSGICPPGVTTAALMITTIGNTVGAGALNLALTATSGVRVYQHNTYLPAASFDARTMWVPVLPSTPSIYWVGSGVAGQLFFIDIEGYRFAR